jgi:hypothetical protein
MQKNHKFEKLLSEHINRSGSVNFSVPAAFANQ